MTSNADQTISNLRTFVDANQTSAPSVESAATITAEITLALSNDEVMSADADVVFSALKVVLRASKGTDFRKRSHSK